MKQLLPGLAFLLFTLVSFGQSVLDKSLTVEINQTPLPDALLQIGQAAGVNIGFQGDAVPADRFVSLSFEQTRLAKALDQCLTQTSLAYEVSGNGILIFDTRAATIKFSACIFDRESGKRLAGAHVFDLLSKKGTHTNERGLFELKVSRGRVLVLISYMGYKSRRVSLQLEKDTSLRFSLSPTIELPEVIIHRSIEPATSISSLSGHPLELKHLAGAGQVSPLGEGDLLSGMAYLAGVNPGNDGFGGLHVRGGNADQNQILLDGVSIFQPSHALGLFSIFDPGITASAQFTKGGFRAQYGNQLSSVLDITTKNGDLERYHGALSTSLISTRLTAEGPLVKNKLSFLITGRHSHINPYFRKSQEKKKEEKGYTGTTSLKFHDLYAKLFYRPNRYDQIYFNLFSGSDRLYDEWGQTDTTPVTMVAQDEQYRYRWKSTTTSVRWNHIDQSERLSTSFLIYYSRYTYENEVNQHFLRRPTDSWLDHWNEEVSLGNQLSTFGLSYLTNFYPNHHHHIQLGAKFTYRDFIPDRFGTELQDLSNVDPGGNNPVPTISQAYSLNLKTRQISLFAEDRFQFGRFSGHLGMNGVIFYDEYGKDFLLQPRILLKYQPNDHWNWRFSIDHTAQYVQQLTSSQANLPSDPWVPVSTATGPQEAWQVGLGGQWLTDETTFVGVEAYWKWMDELTTISLGRDQKNGIVSKNFRVEDWEQTLATSFGRSYGLETTIGKEWSKLFAQFSHTLGWAYQYVPGETRRQHPRYARHNVSVSAQLQLTDKLSCSVGWMYRSGTPIYNTAISDIFPLLENNADKENIYQGSTGEAYHRLDIGMQFQWKKGIVSHQLKAGIYNAYNRNNIITYLPANSVTTDDSWYRVNALPLLPSISYRLSL